MPNETDSIFYTFTDIPSSLMNDFNILVEEIINRSTPYLHLLQEDSEKEISQLSEKRKSIQKVFQFLQGKWTIDILYIIFLYRNPSFNTIRNTLTGINAHTLTKRLTLFESEQMVKRIIIQERPVRVKYELTSKGIEIISLLLPVIHYLSCPDDHCAT